MKRRIACVVFGFVLGTAIGNVSAQQPDTPHVTGIDLTVRDIVEILADYSVEHAKQTVGPPAYGMSDFENRRIYIFDSTDMTGKRMTVIHELLHVRYRVVGMEPPEEFILAEEARQFQALFGVRVAANPQAVAGQ